MSTDEELKRILIDIRDNQRESLRRQEEHLEISKLQLERAKSQIAESIQLQKEAAAKARAVMRIAIPGIVLCIGLIIYLVVKYF